MKNTLIFINLLLISFGLAQENNAQEPNRWRLGGGIGLSVGSDEYFALSVSPTVGYAITPQLEGGVSVGYQYASNSFYKQNLFNFGPYLNYYPVNFLFLRGHFEQFTGNTKFKFISDINESKDNFNESALWLGGGYRSPGPVSFYAGIMYNVLYKEDDSIFDSGLRPILGISISL